MKGNRVFLAVNLSVDVLRAVGETQRDLRLKCMEAGWEINWIAPSQLYVLLRYLGEINGVLAEPMEASLRSRVEPGPPIPLRAKGVRPIELPSKDREIIVGVDDPAGALSALNDTLDEPLVEMGFRPRAPESESPPRLVVARVGSTTGDVPLEELLEPMRDVDFGLCTARDLFLYENGSVPLGEEYLRLWRIAFQGAPIPLEQEPPVAELPQEDESSREEESSAEAPDQADQAGSAEEPASATGEGAEDGERPDEETPSAESEEISEEKPPSPADDVSEES